MNIARKNTLCIVALLDGRPGHEKQTKGIIQALQNFVPVETREIRVSPDTPLTLLRQLLLLYLSGNGVSHPRVAAADLLIGTGRRTHLPLLLFKQRYKLPAVTCMAPASFLRHSFDLCFVPEHDGLNQKENIVFTTGAPNCSLNKGRHDSSRGLIVLGGVDVKSHHWDSGAIAEMVLQIVQKQADKIWTIASSPRTPRETSRLMTELAHGRPNISFFDFKDTEPGWIERQYDENSTVWVTSDSISMIYEALSAGCKVGILPMQWKKQTSKFKKNEEILLKKKLVVSYSSWLKGETAWQKNFNLNEAQRCAERILQKWWPIN